MDNHRTPRGRNVVDQFLSIACLGAVSGLAFARMLLAIALLLCAPLAAQNYRWWSSFPSAFKQPAAVGGNHQIGNWNGACTPGEVALGATGVWSNTGSISCIGTRPTPVAAGGGLYYTMMPFDTFVPMLMIAPYTPSVSIQIDGADAGFDRLYVDPGTMSTQFVYFNMPSVHGAYGPAQYVAGYPNTNEYIQAFYYDLPDPQPLYGLSFTAQWVISENFTSANWQVRFSDAVRLDATITP